MPTIGQCIKQLRNERQYSTGHLSELSGVPVSQINDYENNKPRPINVNVLQKLADSLNVPLFHLFPIQNHIERTLIEEEKVMLDIYEQLKPDQRQAVIQLLKSFTS